MKIIKFFILIFVSFMIINFNLNKFNNVKASELYNFYTLENNDGYYYFDFGLNYESTDGTYAEYDIDLHDIQLIPINYIGYEITELEYYNQIEGIWIKYNDNINNIYFKYDGESYQIGNVIIPIEYQAQSIGIRTKFNHFYTDGFFKYYDFKTNMKNNKYDSQELYFEGDIKENEEIKILFPEDVIKIQYYNPEIHEWIDYNLDYTNFKFSYNENYVNYGDITINNIGQDHIFGLRFINEDRKPVIDGETAFVTNVDNPIDLNEILSHINAYDDFDGDLTHRIVVEDDNYTENKYNVGDYEIRLSVTDNSGNTAYLTVTVLVRDIEAPIVTNYFDKTISYKEKLDLEEIKSEFVVTDNYYELSSDDIIIEENNYTSNWNKLGKYEVHFSVTDPSNNKFEFYIQIEVIDDVEPVFSGIKTISKNPEEILTINDIKNQISVYDEIDGDITNKIKVIEDKYTGNANKSGDYYIVFEVEDNSGNKATHRVDINVIDNIPPIFFIDNYFITVEESFTLTNEDIIEILRVTGQLEVTTNTYVNFLYNEYTGNENIPGIYALSIETKDRKGNEKVLNLAIKVTEAKDFIELEPEKEDNIFYTPKTWYEWIIAPFIWLYQLIMIIINFFINLF